MRTKESVRRLVDITLLLGRMAAQGIKNPKQLHSLASISYTTARKVCRGLVPSSIQRGKIASALDIGELQIFPLRQTDIEEFIK